MDHPQARLHVPSWNTQFWRKHLGPFCLKRQLFLSDATTTENAEPIEQYAKRSFKNRRRRYGLIRQNEDIRNMQTQRMSLRLVKSQVALQYLKRASGGLNFRL